MKARIVPAVDHNRHRLADVLPLSAPYTIYIEPTRACNLKCFFCMHATRDEKGGIFDQTGYEIKHISEHLYEKIVREIMEFPEHPKKITFSGLGEPLMNPRLPLMIKQLRESGYKNRLEIITNGVMLNRQLSRDIIDAGLSRINISIEGLTTKKYKENCSVAVDVDKLCEEIQYFYDYSRGKTEVYIKIIDAELEKGEEETFYQMFGNMCDMIYIEHLLVLEQQMGDHGGIVDTSKNLYSEPVKENKVCSVATYFLSLNADGDVFPCPVVGLPKSFALDNVNEHSLLDIWNGAERRKFLCQMFEGKVKEIPVCQTCHTFCCVMDDAENLDDCMDEMLGRYGGQDCE